jgi:hypothetical protein
LLIFLASGQASAQSLILSTQCTGTVTASPAQTNYTADQTVTLTATPGRWYAFSRWSDGILTNPRTITIGASNIYTAIFTNTVPLEQNVFKQWEQTFRGNGNDFWLVKLDGNGDKQWEKLFGGTSNDSAFIVRQTSDGGYVLGGQSNSGVSGNKTSANLGANDIWIIKVDGSGNKQWEQTLGGSGIDGLAYADVLRQTSDGGYILAGNSRSGVSGNKTTAGFGGTDWWLVKLGLQEDPVGTPTVLVNGQFSPSNSFNFFSVFSIPVTLQTTFPNGTIRYTLDGSTPTTNSTRYAAPFCVTRTCSVRAIAFTSDNQQVAESDPVDIIILYPPAISVQPTNQILLI